jgi:hypothetical protein
MELYFQREQKERLTQPEPRLRGTLLAFIILLLWCMAVGTGVFLAVLVWTSSHPLGLGDAPAESIR